MGEDGVDGRTVLPPSDMAEMMRLATFLKQHSRPEVARFVALLDACVLVPVSLADTLMHLAIVTNNTRDFSTEVLDEFGLHAVAPDGFLLDQLDLAPGAVLSVLRRQAADARRPPLTIHLRGHSQR